MQVNSAYLKNDEHGLKNYGRGFLSTTVKPPKYGHALNSRQNI